MTSFERIAQAAQNAVHGFKAVLCARVSDFSRGKQRKALVVLLCPSSESIDGHAGKLIDGRLPTFLCFISSRRFRLLDWTDYSDNFVAWERGFLVSSDIFPPPPSFAG
ncbi:UNVERIFIED_CONTAM: hypothetical protein K2H54_019618 [Gekko kuhli]